jgi:hypothetical protein
MCASLCAGDNERTLAVTELPFSEVRLERRSLLPGYCIVVWKLGHIVEPTQLDNDAAAGDWGVVFSVAGGIEARFDPMKINLLTLGNWVPRRTPTWFRATGMIQPRGPRSRPHCPASPDEHPRTQNASGGLGDLVARSGSQSAN